LLGRGAGATLALAVFVSAACGAGLSDLDWALVSSVEFVPYPQAAEPGERVSLTVAFEVPDAGTRVVGVQVASGLSYEFYQPGSCEGGVGAEEPRPETEMQLCLTLCISPSAAFGEREIRIEAITGANAEVVALGTFVVLERYGTGPPACP